MARFGHLATYERVQSGRLERRAALPQPFLGMTHDYPCDSPLTRPKSSVELGVRLAFELSRQSSVALVSKHTTYREDTERRLAIEKFLKRHYDPQVDFAHEHGQDSYPKPVLVTGEFAVIAYSHNSVRLEGSARTNCGPRSPSIETAPF